MPDTVHSVSDSWRPKPFGVLKKRPHRHVGAVSPVPLVQPVLRPLVDSQLPTPASSLIFPDSPAYPWALMPRGLSPEWPCSCQCVVAAAACSLLSLDTEEPTDSPSNPEFRPTPPCPPRVSSQPWLCMLIRGVTPPVSARRLCLLVC